jgi:hypothetical protein
MNRVLLLLGLLLSFVLFLGSATKQSYHETDLPDPKTFNAHFPDMDTSGDELVSWPEFKAYFPQAEPKVFEALDLNKDKVVDHDEWHEFKAAHGLEHKD